MEYIDGGNLVLETVAKLAAERVLFKLGAYVVCDIFAVANVTGFMVKVGAWYGKSTLAWYNSMTREQRILYNEYTNIMNQHQHCCRGMAAGKH